MARPFMTRENNHAIDRVRRPSVASPLLPKTSARPTGGFQKNYTDLWYARKADGNGL